MTHPKTEITYLPVFGVSLYVIMNGEFDGQLAEMRTSLNPSGKPGYAFTFLPWRYEGPIRYGNHPALILSALPFPPDLSPITPSFPTPEEACSDLEGRLDHYGTPMQLTPSEGQPHPFLRLSQF